MWGWGGDGDWGLGGVFGRCKGGYGCGCRWDNDILVVVIITISDHVARNWAQEAGQRPCNQVHMCLFAFVVVTVCICEGVGGPAHMLW